MTYTESEYAALLARGNVREVQTQHCTILPPAVILPAVRRPATLVPKIDRFRSKAERRYADLLTHWQREGEVIRWDYEPIKLWLAPLCTITIDFMVIWSTRPKDIEFHEVKGLWVREDAQIKLKMAAAKYPMFPVYLAQWKDNAWHHKRVPAY